MPHRCVCARRTAPFSFLCRSGAAARGTSCTCHLRALGLALTQHVRPSPRRRPAGAFDLGSFKAATPSAGFYHATDSGGHDYYFDACGAIKSVTCQGSSAPDPVAVQTWGEPAPQPPSFPQDSCGALGADSTQSCHSTNASALQCDYSQGDGGRTVSIRYKCAPVATPPTASQPDQSVTHYVIDFSGPGGCAGAGGGGGGWGKLFLILFFVFTTLYFGGGFGYNYKYKDLRGAEAVPQIEYWKQVPGLVHDGCVFSYQQTSIFVAYLNEKRQGGPADPGLKRALAENEDGGESSTAYEESKA